MLAICAPLVFGAAGGVHAQAPDSAFVISTSFNAEEYVAANAPISIALNRWPAPSEGRLAVMIGSQDMSAVFDRVGAQLVFRGRGFALPSGEQTVGVYLVNGSEWREVARMPIKVLTPHGFKRASLAPSIGLSNKGQLAEGHSGTAPPPARGEYQDFGGTFGLQSTHARNVWTFQSQINLLGVSNRTEALRFGQMGDDAPRFDLSDFVLRLERPGIALSAGHVSFGSSRHLINSFSSRGVTAQLQRGRATLSFAGMNGSSIVGADNLFGMSDSDHRMLSANLGVDVLPSRPGALQVNVAYLDGSVLPNPGFSAGGIVDAETSDGASVHVAGNALAQRLTFAGGYTTTRFSNRPDPELMSNPIMQGERKGARFGELQLGILQNKRIMIVNTTLTTAFRHERVEPLFRSVAASTQADIEQNTVDLNGSVDAVNFQISHSRTRDNLDDLVSVLTTKSRNASAQFTTPLAALLRMQHGAHWWPMLSVQYARSHQAGVGVPTNSDFQPSHVPDQVSWMRNYAAQWQGSRWRFAYQHNRSRQDNRQVGRERSDLTGRGNTMTVGLTLRSNIDVVLDGALERQENLEFTQLARLWRTGVGVDWRMNDHTTVNAAVSHTKSRDEPQTNESESNDVRLEVSHRFDVWRNNGAAKRGQLFLRFARQGADMLQFGDPALTPISQMRGAWSLASGLNFRLF